MVVVQEVNICAEKKSPAKRWFRGRQTWPSGESWARLPDAKPILRAFCLVAVAWLLPLCAVAASKPHVVAFGKTTAVKLFVGPSEDKTLDISVRPLYVDTRMKEFTTGDSHDVTDREFVVRRAYRINDTLPEDGRKAPKWLWQRGGWLLVDRVSGKIALVKLPDFDPFYSEASWYRDYAAYCGITSNGEQVTAVVSEIGNRSSIKNSKRSTWEILRKVIVRPLTGTGSRRG
jgi:hypothetical protein